MRRRNDTLCPVLANAGRRREEPLLHATDVGVIARPGHEAPGDSAVAIKTLAAAP